MRYDRRVNYTAEKDRHFASLMRRAQDGDGSAYVQLLKELMPLLRQIVRRHRSFLQRTDIEDIVQDISLSLHAVRATYDPDRPFLPWLMAIARNRMTDDARRYIRRASHEVPDSSEPVTFSDEGANIDVGEYRDPAALRRAIQRLPKGQRQAIEMLKLKEMSLKEASALSGVSIGALKVAVHRGIIALRKALSKDD